MCAGAPRRRARSIAASSPPSWRRSPIPCTMGGSWPSSRSLRQRAHRRTMPPRGAAGGKTWSCWTGSGMPTTSVPSPGRLPILARCQGSSSQAIPRPRGPAPPHTASPKEASTQSRSGRSRRSRRSFAPSPPPALTSWVPPRVGEHSRRRPIRRRRGRSSSAMKEHGLAPDVESACTRLVTIPGSGQVESLNLRLRRRGHPHPRSSAPGPAAGLGSVKSDFELPPCAAS